MDCVVEPDLRAFADRAVPFLSARPVEHSVMLTILAARRSGAVVDPAPPVCAYALDASGAVVGAALRTPPQKAVLSAMPGEAVDALEAALAAADPGCPGVTGRVDAARRFADLRATRTGAEARTGMRQRMYVLGTLEPPRGVEGSGRVAGDADVPLLARWWQEFAHEALPGAPTGDTAAAVRSRLVAGAMHLWQVDGEAVAMAGYVGPQAGVARVAPVYTPPRHRRRGYGAAATAATTAHALDRGASDVMLYTDLSNPTSNGIYQTLGFRPLGDVTDYWFEPPPPGARTG